MSRTTGTTEGVPAAAGGKTVVVTGEQIGGWWRNRRIREVGTDFAKCLGAALVAEAINFTVQYVIGQRGRVIDVTPSSGDGKAL